jgi:Kef-type K+ transport system membrane component KefB
MTTSIPTLTALLPLSTGIALTGLLLPIGLSFLLTPMFGFPLLHAFAAGAALSSTSLGTVLALIGSSGLDIDLQKTKLGTALLGSAVMDDVVAFVLSEIVHLLGEQEDGAGSSLGAHIGRTIGVTFGLGILAIPVTRFVLAPLYMRYAHSAYREKAGKAGFLGIMAVLFIGMTAGARYAGTSPLYGVYVGGLVVSYLEQVEEEDFLERTRPGTRRGSDEEVLDEREGQGHSLSLGMELQGEFGPGNRLRRATTHPTPVPMDRISSRHSATHATSPTPVATRHLITFTTTFEHYISPVLLYLLLPLFFASIGYSIPFIPLWKGRIIWKGLVYTLLMVLAKLVTGLWILFWPIERRKAPWGETLRLRLPAALTLGFAMVARGEIGLLYVPPSTRFRTRLLMCVTTL